MKKSVLIASLAGIMIAFSCKTHFQTTTEAFTVQEHPNSFERGKNLTFNICGQCHYNYMVADKSFIGKEMKDLPRYMGTVYSVNLTNHPAHVMAAYSDAEIFYLIKTGIAKDGRFIPYMIRPTIADRDLNDIIFYLRSGDDPVKARDTSVGQTHLSLIGKLAVSVGGKPQPFERGKIAPEPSDAIAYGRYLVDEIGCYHCHSKSILGLNYRNPEDSKGYMAGGMKWKMNNEKIFAPNLTPDKETGIGNYTASAFRQAVQQGIALNGKALRPPMPRFKHLTDEQSDAIFAYLRTLQPVTHKIRGH